MNSRRMDKETRGRGDGRRKALLLVLCLCAGLCGDASSWTAGAADLEVAAGEPAAVVISVPTNASVGEPFTVKLEVRDRFGNVVTDYDRRGAGYELSVIGRGEIWPKTVQPKSFEKGVADVPVVYKIAERIEIAARSLKSEAEKIEGRSVPFNVAAGKLADLRVVPPMSARAGTPFRVTLMALDAYGNLIKDFQTRTDGVILSVDGPGTLTPTRVSAAAFTDGVTDVTAVYTGSGEVEFRGRDPKSGVSGKSPSKVRIGAGEPALFKVTAPESVLVDELFDIAITAIDKFGNVVLDYDAVGTVVFLGSDGSAAPVPAEAPARRFSQGVAFVKVSYSKPENISIAASEPGTNCVGASGRIDVKPGRPKQLEIVAPTTADAGMPFVVTVRALDSRGNVTQAPEGRIMLSVLGSIGTTPLEITSSMFKNGVAERKMTYNVAEEIVLTAKDIVGELRSDPARVRVRPGKVVTVDLAAPPSVAAGSGIPVVVMALDGYRNVVTEVDASVGRMRLWVDGPDAAPSIEVQPSAFSHGKAMVTVPHFRAGAVRVTADVLGRKATSGAVEVVPGPLHHFDIYGPVQARAGEAFRMTLTAKDAFGNTIVDYNRTGGGAHIQSTGVGEIQPSQVSTSAFKNGVAQVDLRSFVAERIVLAVSERFGSATGRSAPIRIMPGPLSHFLVSVSPRVRAGELFPIRIEAQDVYYNVLKDFSYPGRIRLTAAGQGKVIPEEIGAGDFSEGVAVIQAYLTGSGATELGVATEDRQSIGRSNPIQVMPSGATAYRVDVLEAVRAGEPFRIRVTAQDAYGNVVDDPKSIGRPVRLDVSAAGGATGISPSELSPAMFSRGMAEGYVVYPQAGRITMQVKGGGPAREEEDAGKSHVEGLYFKGGAAQTDIYVIATGPVDAKPAEPVNYVTGIQTLVIHFPNSGLLKSYNYDAMKLPGLRAARLAQDAGMSPRLILKMDASYQPSIQSRANLLHVTLRPSGTAGPAMLRMTGPEPAAGGGSAVPSLADIQMMIERGDYKPARKAVELYLTVHPGHPEASALKTRLDKVLRVLGE